MKTLRVLLVIVIVALVSCQSDIISSLRLEDNNSQILNQLSGTGWNWVKYIDNNGKIILVSDLTKKDFVLNFVDNTNLKGRSGCNSYSAKYTIINDFIKLDSLWSTMVLCDLSDLYTNSLSQAKTFQANEKELLLKTNNPDCSQMYFKRL